MLKLNDKQQRTIPGGHQFYEYGIMFKGETFKEVSVKLKDFRINNNLPVGDPEQEILVHYASKWPWMVKQDENSLPRPNESGDYADLRNWVYKVWRKPPVKFISDREAGERIGICAKCPLSKSKDWAETLESKELEKRIFVLRRGLGSPGTYCRCHHADIGTLSYISSAREFSSATTEQPKECWV